MQTPAPPLRRRAGRVLLVDADDRLLLFRGGDMSAPEGGTWWFTPGGGINEGEGIREAAVRELFEETGLRCDTSDLTGPVHEEESLFEFARQSILQHSTFFVLRVASHDVDISGFDEIEVNSIVEHRWWRLDELRVTEDVFYPKRLVELLDQLL